MRIILFGHLPAPVILCTGIERCKIGKRGKSSTLYYRKRYVAQGLNAFSGMLL